MGCGGTGFVFPRGKKQRKGKSASTKNTIAMKNGYLTIGLSLFLLTFFPCRAQEESPGMDYLEENKTWSSHHFIYNNGSWSTLFWIEGEMEVSGMVWKKLYSSRHEDRSGASYILLCQEGRKVYS